MSFVDQYMLFCFIWYLLHKDEVVKEFLKPDRDEVIRETLRKEASEDGA